MKQEQEEKGFKRRSIKQHKDLLLDPRYKHKVEVNRKVRLHFIEEEDFEKELKEYLDGVQ